MIYETIENGRSFSGEVDLEESPVLVLLDELDYEHISFSKVKKELNKEFKFCSHRVLVEYLSDLSINY
jgi:hypothetical protein